MAEGALIHSEADIAVAVTGVAGPGGGSGREADRPRSSRHSAARHAADPARMPLRGCRTIGDPARQREGGPRSDPDDAGALLGDQLGVTRQPRRSRRSGQARAATRQARASALPSRTAGGAGLDPIYVGRPATTLGPAVDGAGARLSKARRTCGTPCRTARRPAPAAARLERRSSMKKSTSQPPGGGRKPSGSPSCRNGPRIEVALAETSARRRVERHPAREGLPDRLSSRPSCRRSAPACRPSLLALAHGEASHSGRNCG